MSDVVVTDNPAESRFEATLDGQLAGFAVYDLMPEVIVFTHTEVFDAFEGHGVGGAIARFALDDVRRAGERRVDPQCPFIAAWIDKHPDYRDLLVGA